MNFNITKNTFATDKNSVHSLHMESDEYFVIFYYMGNYKQDFENHTIDKDSISVTITPRNQNLPIKRSDGKLYIDLSYSPYFLLDVTECDELKEKLNIAKDTVLSLQTLLHQYFRI